MKAHIQAWFYFLTLQVFKMFLFFNVSECFVCMHVYGPRTHWLDLLELLLWLPRLNSNSWQSSCLSDPSAKITDMSQHT